MFGTRAYYHRKDLFAFADIASDSEGGAALLLDLFADRIDGCLGARGDYDFRAGAAVHRRDSFPGAASGTGYDGYFTLEFGHHALTSLFISGC